MMERPIVGITMGDPAGCGPEITLKALARPDVYQACRPLVIGDAEVMRRALKAAGHPELQIHPVTEVSQAQFLFGTVDVYHLELIDMEQFVPGKITAMCGNAAFQCVKTVIELALAGEIDATVTNAISKEAINLAGFHYSGHTEIYAALTKTTKYTMMLAHHDLRVVHVSTHVSLRQACDLVKKERVLEVIRIADRACRDLGISSPKIGVAGLNPHAGENGMFGTEEIEQIIPAIEQAQREGIDAQGPIPPDTAFSKAKGGWYDVVVCMYHDQGHIPLKVLGFVYDREKAAWAAVEGVNITLGLPVIRTSVDHGTAFGHAWTGVANELSLVNAIDYALRLTRGKIKTGERAEKL